MQYKIKKITAIRQSGAVEGDPVDLQVYEFDPDKNKKYMIAVEIGDLAPRDIFEFLQIVKETCKDIFPSGQTLYVPCHHGKPTMEIFELINIPEE